jgi:hypothetical protein
MDSGWGCRHHFSTGRCGDVGNDPTHVAPKRQGGATSDISGDVAPKEGSFWTQLGLQQSPFGEPQPGIFPHRLTGRIQQEAQLATIGMGGPCLVHVTDDSAEVVSTIEAANLRQRGLVSGNAIDGGKGSR